MILSLKKVLLYPLSLILLSTFIVPLSAQTLGNWSFNGNTNGTPGTYNTVSKADFSSTATSKGYSGDVYYGENGWPTGAMNPAAYMEFSLTPASGYSLNIISVAMNMRRSNTGSPSGSGPTAWILRSSVDGFTANLGSGSMNHNGVLYTVTPPSGFDRLASAVTFRVYGYNATTSSGGLSRMVFDNIQVTGSNIVLPLSLAKLTASYVNGQITLSANISDIQPGYSYAIERSMDGITYKTIKELGHPAEGQLYTYLDTDPFNALQKLYYRICIRSPDGHKQYSPIVLTTIPERTETKLSARVQGKSIQLASSLTGPYAFTLYNSGGTSVFRKQFEQLDATTILSLPALSAGIYYAVLRNSRSVQAATVRLR